MMKDFDSGKSAPKVIVDYESPQPNQRRWFQFETSPPSSWFAVVAFAGFGLLFLPGLAGIGLLMMGGGAGCYIVSLIHELTSRLR